MYCLKTRVPRVVQYSILYYTGYCTVDIFTLFDTKRHKYYNTQYCTLVSYKHTCKIELQSENRGVANRCFHLRVRVLYLHCIIHGRPLARRGGGGRRAIPHPGQGGSGGSGDGGAPGAAAPRSLAACWPWEVWYTTESAAGKPSCSSTRVVTPGWMLSGRGTAAQQRRRSSIRISSAIRKSLRRTSVESAESTADRRRSRSPLSTKRPSGKRAQHVWGGGARIFGAVGDHPHARTVCT